MKVIVSNPIKHHSHQLIIGLQKKGYFHRFFTSIWIAEQSFIIKALSFISPSLGQRLLEEFRKRTNPNINSSKVNSFPLAEFMRKALFLNSERWVFLSDRLHDQYFSRRLKNLEFDIFIGSEKSSVECFKMAEQRKKIKVLDLAQVHFEKIELLRSKFLTLDRWLVSGNALHRINAVKKKELELADYIFTLSEMTKQSLIAANVNERKIKKINLGFDPSKFSLKSYSLKKPTFTLLYVGAVTRRKGIELICKAVSKLNYPNIRFVVVGSLVEEDLLDLYKDVITYHKFVDQGELIRFYQDADVFVFPSYLDSWGMVVLEAMACGTPVIISENTGSKDIVANGGGFIIPPDNVDELAVKIDFLYQNRELLEKMGLQAHGLVQEYTWERYHNNLSEVLDDIYIQYKKDISDS